MKKLPFTTSLDRTETTFKFLLACENFIEIKEVRDIIRSLNMVGVLVKVAEEMVDIAERCHPPYEPSYCNEALWYAKSRRAAELSGDGWQLRMF